MNRSYIGWLMGDTLEILIGAFVMFSASSLQNWCGLLGSFLVALGLIRLNQRIGSVTSMPFDDRLSYYGSVHTNEVD